MKTVFITLFLFTKIYCSLDSAEWPRNFSIKFVSFTHQEKDGHLVVSPLGVWSLLTSITTGATGNSRRQLITRLSLPNEPNLITTGYTDLMQTVLSSNSNAVTLTSKNFLFFDNKLKVKGDFRQTITEDFGAVVHKMNFKDSDAANVANSIIENSGASVHNVFSPEDFRTSRMILTNVISFKGSWMSPFHESDTSVEPFYDENRNEIGKVNMMKQRKPLSFSNMKNMKFRILELPYGHDDKYSMLIILPHLNVTVMEVYDKLEKMTMFDMLAKLDSDNKVFGIEEVDVQLPRFKISTNVVLNKPLHDMGVVDIFDSTYASFENVSNEELYVSAILHKADIEVTETGTTATAASSAYFANRISPGIFHANKPFIYFIIEKPTATVIFGGFYSKPSIF